MEKEEKAIKKTTNGSKEEKNKEGKVEKAKKSTNKKDTKDEKVAGKVVIEEKAQKQLNKNKTKKKQVNKILLVVIIIVIALVIIIGCIFGSRISNKAKLDKEIDNLFAGNIEIENIEIKTTGDFATVERAIKEYYKEYSACEKELMKNIDDEKIQNMLSIENYVQDGPEFVESKQYISSAKESLNKTIENITNLLNSENIMSRIENKGLSDYYVQLYKNYFFAGEDLTEIFKEVLYEINGTKDLMNNLYDNEMKILNFLSENKDHWKVLDSKISFDSTSLLAQYNSLKVQLSVQ